LPPRKESQLGKLVELIARLRAPNGCPWDRAQTHKSLIPFLREEALEVEQAIRRGRWHELEDELGDLLLQILLHAEIAREKKQFNIEDVARSQYLKLKRRHPHVFGDAHFPTAEAVLRGWKEIKTHERKLRKADLIERVKRRQSRR
jgi:MazG family protein